MQLGRRHFKLHGKAVIASLLVCLVLLLDAMAACPALHELIHNDAGKPEHQCAITLFAHGQVESATVEVLATAPVVLTDITPQIKFPVFTPAIENLPAEHGPPAAASNS